MNKLQEIQPIDNYYLHRLKLRLENLKSMRALLSYLLMAIQKHIKCVPMKY